MIYSYEEPREEQHCISVDGKEAKALCIFKEYLWVLKDEVKDWLLEQAPVVNSVLSSGNDPDDDQTLVYTFRFKTKEAALLFKVTFGGRI